MVSVLALLGPSALVLLSAPARLSPTRVRSALLCDTGSVRQAVPQCRHGSSSRRAALSRSAAAGASAVAAAIAPGAAAQAAITKDSEWPLWLALPVAPYSRRKTIRREVGPGAGGHVERGMGQCAQRHQQLPLGPRCISQYMPRQRQIKLRAAPPRLDQLPMCSGM